MKYKFRAECKHDYDCLLQILPTKPKNEVIDPLLYGLPDVVISFDLEMKLNDLRKKMKAVEDGHVMVQTVMFYDEYTGDRNYDL